MKNKGNMGNNGNMVDNGNTENMVDSVDMVLTLTTIGRPYGYPYTSIPYPFYA